MPLLPEPLSEALDALAGRPPAGLGRRPVPARVRRAVDQGVAIEHGRAVVMAARVRALGHVAHEAMQEVGQLSQLEQHWRLYVPHAAGRLQAIADIAALQAAEIVSDMGRDQ